MGEAERGDAAPRLHVSYYCASGHETRPAFAADAVIPESWDCPRCGLPANTDAEAAQILEEAVSSLRARRAAGEILY